VYKEDLSQNYDPERTSYTILTVTLFSTNYSNTHKSRLKYKVKCDLYKISSKTKKNL